MPLSDVQCRNAKPADKPYKLTDGNGLYLYINQVGKYWRYNYRYQGKQKTLAVGTYPETLLSLARQKLTEAKRQLADGKDPMATRKAEKLAAKERASQTFELVALKWHEQKDGEWTPGYHAQVLRILNRYLFPVIGYRPIIEIDAPELLRALDGLVQCGALETAKRALSDAQAIWAYAIAKGYATRNVAADLRGILPSPKVKHHAAITDPAQVGTLLQAIDGYEGSLVVKCALRLLPYVFTRPKHLDERRRMSKYGQII